MLIGVGSALAFAGIHELKLLDSGAGAFARSVPGSALLHGLAGGLRSVALGGKFGSGFLAAGFSNLAGNFADFGDRGANTVAHAIVGGLASELGGGKFESGAITAAFGYLYNDTWENNKNLTRVCGPDGDCLTRKEVGSIVFNETRSLSGADLFQARVDIAHAIMNAQRRWGADRER